MNLDTKEVELEIKERLEKVMTIRSKTNYRNKITPTILGNECDRYVWLSLNWVTKPLGHSDKSLRLFETGRIEEGRLIKWLEMAGLIISTADPATGEQWEVTALGGHFSGRVDGIITRGMPKDQDGKYVLECKTHNQKSFEDLINKGVIKSKPSHYMQMQLYMYLLNIDKGLYAAKNKNDEQLHFEIIHLDVEYAKQVGDRAARLMASRVLPEPISKSPYFYLCKSFKCDFYDFCFGNVEINKNCRTCQNLFPKKEGIWECSRLNKKINKSAQEIGCSDHIYKETLTKKI